MVNNKKLLITIGKGLLQKINNPVYVKLDYTRIKK